MQTSVNLQEPFSYSIYYIITILFLILAINIYFFFIRKKKTKEVIEIKEITVENREQIKQRYIKELNELERKVNQDEMTVRLAYQKLSQVIRYFVYELTGIQVQNYTLKEIKEANIPILYELIKEYYIPEFARRYLGDIKSSIDKTRKVIEKWN